MSEAEQEQPTRQAPVQRRCLCVLIEGTTQDGTPLLNSCASTMTNPDAPMCMDCMDAGHEHRDRVPYAEVMAARQEGRLIR